MKHLNELRAELAPIRADLEIYRLRYLKKAKSAQMLLIFPLLLFIGSIVGMFLLYDYYFYFVIAMILSTLLTAFIYLKLYSPQIQDYQKKFKSVLLEKIVHALYPDMQYKADGYIAKEVFYKSDIFSGKADEGYTGEDYFEGVINNVPIRFSEVNAKRLKGKNTTVLFSGIFMVLDVKKEFKGTTLVLPDDYEQLFGQLAVQLQAKLVRIEGSELIYLKKNPNFEDKFVIYSTEKQEALDILNDSMLDNLLWIRNRYNSELSIAFKGGFVYLAISLGYKGLFDADIHKSLTKNDELFDRIYAELVTCFRLVKHLPIKHLN